MVAFRAKEGVNNTSAEARTGQLPMCRVRTFTPRLLLEVWGKERMMREIEATKAMFAMFEQGSALVVTWSVAY